MRDRPGLAETRLDRLAGSGQTRTKEIHVNDVGQIALGTDNALRIKAGKRRVVLVHTLHGNTVGRRAGRRRQRLTPFPMSLVAKARPVNRTEYDRLPGTKKHKANGFQRIVHRRDRRDPATAQRVAQGRSNIETERSER